MRWNFVGAATKSRSRWKAVMKRCLMITCFAILAMSSALAQEKKTVQPPPKPADDGPSLEITMKFIQDKMSDHGTVGYVFTNSSLNGVLFREYSLLSDVVADASTCTLRVKKKKTTQIELANGATYNESGKAVSGDDLHRELVETSTNSFKDVDSIVVEPAQDSGNRIFAETGHPERTLSYIPPVYNLSLKATKKDAFSFHDIFSTGKQAPQNFDFTSKDSWFEFRDEQTANRLAKAMLHAVELCGGGNKEPF
jgi:hypothetical protein